MDGWGSSLFISFVPRTKRKENIRNIDMLAWRIDALFIEIRIVNVFLAQIIPTKQLSSITLLYILRELSG